MTQNDTKDPSHKYDTEMLNIHYIMYYTPVSSQYNHLFISYVFHYNEYHSNLDKSLIRSLWDTTDITAVSAMHELVYPVKYTLY